MNVTWIDITVFTTYFAVILAISLRAGRGEGRSTSEYFLAGGRLPWYVIGASLVAGSVNSEQMVGTVGIAWQEGMKIVNWEIWILPLMPFFFMFIPIYLRNRIATVPEFMAKRFGPRCRDYVSAITVFYYVFASLTVAIYGGAVCLSTFFGFSFYYAVWGIILFTTVYTLYGGLSSIAWTDLLQTLVIMAGGVILFVFVYRETDGLAAMMAADPERWRLIQPATDMIVPWPGLLIHNFTTLFFYYVCSQVLMQKILAARSERDARVGILCCAVMNAPRPLVTAMAGLLAFYLLTPEQVGDQPDRVFVLLLAYVPAGLRSLVLVAILAAMISTTAALANASSALLTLDFYKQYVAKGATEKQLVRFGRIVTLTVLVLVGLWCPMVQHLGHIFLYFQRFMIFVGTPIACVFMMSILWRRMNEAGAFAAMIVATPLFLVLGFVLSAEDSPYRIAFHYIAAVEYLLTFLIAVAVSLATRPPEAKRVQPFLWRREMIRVGDEGTKPPVWLRQWPWFAAVTAIFLFWYIRFW